MQAQTQTQTQNTQDNQTLVFFVDLMKNPIETVREIWVERFYKGQPQGWTNIYVLEVLCYGKACKEWEGKEKIVDEYGTEYEVKVVKIPKRYVVFTAEEIVSLIDAIEAINRQGLIRTDKLRVIANLVEDFIKTHLSDDKPSNAAVELKSLTDVGEVIEKLIEYLGKKYGGKLIHFNGEALLENAEIIMIEKDYQIFEWISDAFEDLRDLAELIDAVDLTEYVEEWRKAKSNEEKYEIFSELMERLENVPELQQQLIEIINAIDDEYNDLFDFLDEFKDFLSRTLQGCHDYVKAFPIDEQDEKYQQLCQPIEYVYLQILCLIDPDDYNCQL